MKSLKDILPEAMEAMKEVKVSDSVSYNQEPKALGDKFMAWLSDQRVIFEIENQDTTYNEARRWLWYIIRHRLEKQGVEFYMDGNLKEVIPELIKWFLGMEGKYNLKKGIWLCGMPGTGKTFLMECFFILMVLLQQKRRAFRIVSMRQLSDDVQNINIPKLSQGMWCFDDVGTESDVSNQYGNKFNIFESIIHQRYERFARWGQLTIVTSNFPIFHEGEDVIASKYGLRTSSRCIQMFTQVKITGDDKRRK